MIVLTTLLVVGLLLLSQEVTAEQCPDDVTYLSSLVFQKETAMDVSETTGTLYGERTFWAGTPFNAQDGSQNATALGYCTVIQEEPLLYLCNYVVEFEEGRLSDSLLTYSGLSVDYGTGSAFLTITGGTGCLANVADGYVETAVPDNPNNTTFESTISFQQDIPQNCPPAADLASVTFREDVTADLFEGNATMMGERILWANSAYESFDGSFKASASGECVVVQEEPIKYFCDYVVAFGGGLFFSTLTYSGVSVDYGDGSSFLTITGGTGCLAGVAGYVESVIPDDASIPFFNSTIYIQEEYPQGCPDLDALEMVVFEEDTSNDHVEGNGTVYGERILWYGTPFNAKDGSQQATSFGKCTVIGESPVLYHCIYTIEFGTGSLSGSALSVAGISLDFGAGAAIFPVTGGTGCFASSSGYVRSVIPDDPNDPIFNTTIHVTRAAAETEVPTDSPTTTTTPSTATPTTIITATPTTAPSLASSLPICVTFSLFCVTITGFWIF